ncbi:hypothetical protein LN565_07265 [Xanthomonas euvesicatoria pv. euvesicatoria]|uniref:Uncharacterized protein n=3 Tax=Xanthomonas euvesicatoria TaxID=456327 RepID=Q3BQ58_XANE5|nr:hypothetical protein [Xanthomonas euvesicatoria]APO89639.1 hypothetical protein BJD11_05905 [Xanthomonas euvesicatoria]KHL60454.1 hypothetical protein XEU66b_16080 [Xanthomonas euvesicatoria]KHL64743.1 hypothetical protein XEU83M_15735 [Xanthomonas euvesicatoria]KLA49466.1 hypothetical protein XEUV683_22130 [Xanthomonas euvesicatoria]KLA49524.1 hypothetical protein XEUV685_22540 [Xanthomonas euvesicatoria]
MKCDLFDERMLLIGGAVPVLYTQRGIVLAGIEQLGITADWSPGTRATTTYENETDEVAVWSLIVRPMESADRLQAWLDAQPG